MRYEYENKLRIEELFDFEEKEKEGGYKNEIYEDLKRESFIDELKKLFKEKE